MNWKKSVFIVFNAVLGAYVVLAMTAFNKPDRKQVCKDVVISIEEGVMDGFLTTSDVKYQIADDVNYCSFYLKYSGSTVTMTRYGGSGYVTNVYGVN